MDKRKLLEPMGVQEALGRLPGWKIDGNVLVRELVFRNFSEAFAFMTRVALIAEAMNHHPEWSNVYKRESLRLSTHSAGGITGLDVTLAEKIGEIQNDNA